MSQAIMEARASAITEMEALSAVAATRSLDETEAARFDTLEAEITELDQRSATTARAAALAASAPSAPVSDIRSAALPATTPAGSPQVTVTAVSPYAGENRSNGWFSDRAALISEDLPTAQVEEARARLVDHYTAVEDEGAARQVRAYSVGTSTEGGYLAAPTYLQDQFAELLRAGRPTADLVGHMPLPATGQTFYIPTQTAVTAVGLATENATLTETNATFGQIQVDATRIGGTATMPNWLVDRSYPNADQIILRDLAKSYAIFVDNVVLNSTVTNRKGLLQETGLGAATVTAGTIASYWPGLLNAIDDVAEGVFAYPDAIVMHPRRWAFLASLLDSAGRPVIGSLNPQNALGGFDGITSPVHFTGPVPVGSLLGVPVYLDANIPTNLGAGTNEDRIIVMKKDEPILMESAPKFAVSPDAQFAKDQLVARVTGDVAFTAARRKGAVSIISGAGLALTA